MPPRRDDTRFVPLAAELADEFAARAAEHDRDNTFVAENFESLRHAGYTALAVPAELGGLGASLRQVCYAQAALARGCGSTALAVNMHVYLTLLNTYRWKHGATEAEDLLRRVVSDGLILMTSGASDGLWPTARATREDGGYRIRAGRSFAARHRLRDVLYTYAATMTQMRVASSSAWASRVVAPAFDVVETWDALGMRGTASQDVQLDEVWIAQSQITGKRPWGTLDAVLRTALIHFALPVAAVYYGIAASARDKAVHIVRRRAGAGGQPLAEDVVIQRTVGMMDARLKTGWWALVGALDELGDDYQYPPDDERYSLCMLAKRSVVLAAQAVVDLAMQAVGGAAYFKRSPIERAYRDVRAGSFHPMSPEITLLFAGRLALEQPNDQTF